MTRIKKKTTRKNALEKIDNATKLMSNSLKNEKRIAFLNKFVLCEIACKHIVEAYKRQTKALKPSEYITLDMRHIPAALTMYEYSIPLHILNDVFGGSGKYKKSGTKSAKKLRDGIMHAMSENDLAEIMEREEFLNDRMDSFLKHFGYGENG